MATPLFVYFKQYFTKKLLTNVGSELKSLLYKANTLTTSMAQWELELGPKVSIKSLIYLRPQL